MTRLLEVLLLIKLEREYETKHKSSCPNSKSVVKLVTQINTFVFQTGYFNV